MKLLLDLLYGAQRRLWRVFRPRTRGVKVMLFNEAGELLLIRNSYGTSDHFLLPGGGIRPRETAERAAAREIAEELNCAVEDLTFVSTHVSTAEGKRDTIQLFRARAGGGIRVDGREVSEAGFFALDALPAEVSPATLRRIEEQLGTEAVREAW